MNVIYESLKAPEINSSEILRYARSRSTAEIEELISSVISECQNELSYNVSYLITDVTAKNGIVTLGSTKVCSTDLSKCLDGYKKAVILGATIGSGIDRLIGKYSRLQPSRALILQAFGAERIESLCDTLCSKIETDLGVKVGPRFSAGYGDLSLDFQKNIFNILRCEKIGLTLNQSLSMSPSKSVTAIAGLK